MLIFHWATKAYSYTSDKGQHKREKHNVQILCSNTALATKRKIIMFKYQTFISKQWKEKLWQGRRDGKKATNKAAPICSEILLAKPWSYEETTKKGVEKMEQTCWEVLNQNRGTHGEILAATSHGPPRLDIRQKKNSLWKGPREKKLTDAWQQSNIQITTHLVRLKPSRIERMRHTSNQNITITIEMLHAGS